MVDIEDINEEGMLMTYRDVEAAYDKLTAAKVDALIFPHCNFGQEEAVGRLAKDMNLPVLIWGPATGIPTGWNGVRRTASAACLPQPSFSCIMELLFHT